MRRTIRYACYLSVLVMMVALVGCKKDKDTREEHRTEAAKAHKDSIDEELIGANPDVLKFYEQIKTLIYITNSIDNKSVAKILFAKVAHIDEDEDEIEMLYNLSLWKRATLLNKELAASVEDMSEALQALDPEKREEALTPMRKISKKIEGYLSLLGLNGKIALGDLPDNLYQDTKKAPAAWIFNGQPLPRVDLAQLLALFPDKNP